MHLVTIKKTKLLIILHWLTLFTVASLSFGFSGVSNILAQMLKVAALHEMSVNAASVLTLALSLAT